GARENLAQDFVVVGDLLAMVLSIGVVVVHVLTQGTGTIKRVESRNVVEAGRRQTAHKLTHLVALELENTDRVSEAKHLEDFGIVERHVVDVDLLAGTAFNMVEGALNDRQ